jgi:hypothetical protein
MTITSVPCTSEDLIRAVARVLSQRDRIEMAEPRLLIELRRKGGLFNFDNWPEPEEEADGQTG